MDEVCVCVCVNHEKFVCLLLPCLCFIFISLPLCLFVFLVTTTIASFLKKQIYVYKVILYTRVLVLDNKTIKQYLRHMFSSTRLYNMCFKIFSFFLSHN